MAKKIMVTYGIVTPESAKHGDYDDTGFICYGCGGRARTPRDVPTGEYVSTVWARGGRRIVSAELTGKKSTTRARKARGKTVRTVEEAANFILDHGRPEPSSGEFDRHGWYSVMIREDYDGSEEWSFHPEGFSLSESRKLYDLLMR
jgi:hypothetical protein